MVVSRQDGPVERWLSHLLQQALTRGGDVDAQISSVDISPAPGRGEMRAYVEFRRPSKPGRAAWLQLAENICEGQAIERAVAIPPSVYITLAPGVLEQGITKTVEEPVMTSLGGRQSTVVVFCSPNTNKPLHIGHLRACFLGMSMTRLLEATGVQVARSQMLSNFGVHMCQALAMHDGTSDPVSAGAKGDHFVGALYRAYHDTVAGLPPSECDGFNCAAPSDGHPCVRCRPLHLLRQMADGDPGLLADNERLGQWAIDGILSTQARIGTTHDTCIREAGVIELANKSLDEAVEAGVCARRPDGSTYIPIQSTGEAELTLLRRDGTSLVYGMLLGVYLSRSITYPGWGVLEFTGEQWRAGRTAMYEVLERIGRSDISAVTEGVFFGMVQTGGRVMSSRSGSAVIVDELLDRFADWASTWQQCPDHVRADAAALDRFGVAGLKYHVLKFPRPQGFSFDEEAVRKDVETRLGALLRVFDWLHGVHADSHRQPPSSRHVRSLALVLAREAAVVRRALSARDPAIIVRYIDDMVDKALIFDRSRVASSSVDLPLERLLRRALALIDIDAADLGYRDAAPSEISAE